MAEIVSVQMRRDSGGDSKQAFVDTIDGGEGSGDTLTSVSRRKQVLGLMRRRSKVLDSTGDGGSSAAGGTTGSHAVRGTSTQPHRHDGAAPEGHTHVFYLLLVLQALVWPAGLFFITYASLLAGEDLLAEVNAFFLPAEAWRAIRVLQDQHISLLPGIVSSRRTIFWSTVVFLAFMVYLNINALEFLIMHFVAAGQYDLLGGDTWMQVFITITPLGCLWGSLFALLAVSGVVLSLHAVVLSQLADRRKKRVGSAGSSKNPVPVVAAPVEPVPPSEPLHEGTMAPLRQDGEGSDSARAAASGAQAVSGPSPGLRLGEQEASVELEYLKMERQVKGLRISARDNLKNYLPLVIAIVLQAAASFFGALYAPQPLFYAPPRVVGNFSMQNPNEWVYQASPDSTRCPKLSTGVESRPFMVRCDLLPSGLQASAEFPAISPCTFETVAAVGEMTFEQREVAVCLAPADVQRLLAMPDQEALVMSPTQNKCLWAETRTRVPSNHAFLSVEPLDANNAIVQDCEAEFVTWPLRCDPAPSISTEIEGLLWFLPIGRKQCPLNPFFGTGLLQTVASFLLYLLVPLLTAATTIRLMIWQMLAARMQGHRVGVPPKDESPEQRRQAEAEAARQAVDFSDPEQVHMWYLLRERIKAGDGPTVTITHVGVVMFLIPIIPSIIFLVYNFLFADRPRSSLTSTAIQWAIGGVWIITALMIQFARVNEIRLSHENLLAEKILLFTAAINAERTAKRDGKPHDERLLHDLVDAKELLKVLAASIRNSDDQLVILGMRLTIGKLISLAVSLLVPAVSAAFKSMTASAGDNSAAAAAPSS